MVCVCCTVRPYEAPERLGLRVLWSRGYRGKKATESGMVEDHGLAPERAEPNVVGSVTEVDLCSSLPSRVPESGKTTLLGDSATTTRRAGLGCAQMGSPVD